MFNFFIKRDFSKLLFALVIIGSLFFWSGAAIADCTENFSWLPNTDSNIAGYKIYYGQTDNGPYPNSVEVNKTSIVDGRVTGAVTGLTCGEQYYFVCVAVNAANVESSYSSQASVTPSAGGNLPGVPVNLMIFE